MSQYDYPGGTAPQGQYYNQPYPQYPPQPVNPVDQLPPQYRPLSPWAYFGLTLLFAVPIVGFVFLIVFSFSDANINRRNYARSYWCALLLCVIIGVTVLLILLATGALAGSSRSYYYR